jgi:hypothetical protein
VECYRPGYWAKSSVWIPVLTFTRGMSPSLTRSVCKEQQPSWSHLGSAQGQVELRIRKIPVAWQIQRWTLAAYHWTEHRVPNEGAREWTLGAEGFCRPIGRTTIWTNLYCPSFQGLNHQPKSTHGRTHGFNHICSRGWPDWSSLGGEALGPVKAQCPSVGKCQSSEHEWMGWWAGVFWRGNKERG